MNANQASSEFTHINNSFVKLVWEGEIPIEFTLDPTDAAALNTPVPEPHYALIRRCSYFPLVTATIIRQLLAPISAFDGKETDIWYSCNRVPLKWNYPIGLLYDLATATSNFSSGAHDGSLPWKVTVHCKEYPGDKLIRSPSSNMARDYFMSIMKEADYLRNGSTKKVMNLSKQDQLQLWDSIVADSFENFWLVNTQLITNDNQPPKHVPLRIYLPADCPILQEPITVYKDSGEEYTIGEIFMLLLPDLFDGPSLPKASAVIHGISLSLDTPLPWLYQNLSFPDNFLHIVITLNNT
ncbi:APG5-domain-containing protein [Basidiobolus meristosporus CBS 931.73]|uniref:Autophagy protein 5 n=1 Tax=Basidiobolus meristosporus CBS 931.73 TaxID=1314790 RepID=A0A1Y1Z1C3_9FUNG|nr:APG5-domain-containing protein [Basidiobolus meristosporus CBS 931.73]|eukprot:ORY03625.1 APG5-domain-containing protein [Basidiobolus meristosporus CBS 931.73]